MCTDNFEEKIVYFKDRKKDAENLDNEKKYGRIKDGMFCHGFITCWWASMSHVCCDGHSS